MSIYIYVHISLYMYIYMYIKNMATLNLRYLSSGFYLLLTRTLSLEAAKLGPASSARRARKPRPPPRGGSGPDDSPAASRAGLDGWTCGAWPGP